MRPAFEVILMPTAESDLAEIDSSIAPSSVAAADRFLELLRLKIESLDLFPRRGATAREGHAFGLRMHQVIVHPYRILYHIRGSMLFVLRVGHGHRRSLDPRDHR